MKKIYILLVVLLNGLSAFAQTYTHPTGNLGGQITGACPISTCSGTYVDDGGSGGNYSNGVNNMWTFCTNTAGTCLRANFTSFNLESWFLGCYDYMYVMDGPSSASTPAYGPFCGNGVANAPGGGTITSTNGCLTFYFSSDGSVGRPGWSATLSCVPCAGGPTGTDGSDCANFTQVCSNAGFPGSSNGPGLTLTSEFCQAVQGDVNSCGVGEHQSAWYALSVGTSGSLQFDIAPNNSGDDYDFAIFGPGATCGSLGNPIRCTNSLNTGNTGLQSGSGDNSEGVFGDSFLDPLNVNAGEVYYLLVDNWSSSNSGFTIDFTGSTATLDCTPLPLELLDFSGELQNNTAKLQWSTKDENGLVEFVIEKMDVDGEWRGFHQVKANGDNSLYFAVDPDIKFGYNYYRLKMQTLDGDVKYSDVVEIYSDKIQNSFKVMPNPITNNLKINFYDDILEDLTMQIMSVSGKIIEEKVISPLMLGPDLSYEYSVDYLENGVYIIKIGGTSQKIIKI